MKLQEFDVELEGEAGAAALQLRLEARCVTALYERCFEGLRTEKTWKVLVECVPFLAERPPPLDKLGVAVVQVEFEWDDYREESDRAKKERVLAALQEGVLSICEAWGWPAEPFENAHQRVFDLDFVNRGIWKKPKSSPNRRLRAEIEYEHEMDRFTLTMVVRDREGSVRKRELLIEERPSEFAFDKHLGQLKWLSNDEVALFPKRGDSPRIVTVD